MLEHSFLSKRRKFDFNHGLITGFELLQIVLVEPREIWLEARGLGCRGSLQCEEKDYSAEKWCTPDANHLMKLALPQGMNASHGDISRWALQRRGRGAEIRVHEVLRVVQLQVPIDSFWYIMQDLETHSWVRIRDTSICIVFYECSHQHLEMCSFNVVSKNVYISIW